MEDSSILGKGFGVGCFEPWMAPPGGDDVRGCGRCELGGILWAVVLPVSMEVDIIRVDPLQVNLNRQSSSITESESGFSGQKI